MTLADIAASLNRGFVSGALGAPVDMANMALGSVGGERPVMGSEWIAEKLASLGLLPQKRDGAGSTLAEIAGGLVNPGMPLKAVALAGKLPAMAVVSPLLARKLIHETKLPTSPEFAEAVANTPGARTTDEGLLMNVMRNQKPEQAGAESVRGGVFYLPEGAAQAKHYSTGKIGYGGKERIEGETLIKNPLFAKGGTGGKAPEAAYDSLLGKGAYQEMRTEALKARGYGVRYPLVHVQEFLDKYAPELSNHADYILQNSREGNQLMYALQEAAVASAVRNAGHDAVVGHSKGKSGRFVSEVFDVRESHYPTKGGEGRVWDDLYKKETP